MILYTRDKGPVCYELALLEGASLTRLPGQLLASGLGFYWESERNAPPSPRPQGPTLPAVRNLTILQPATADAFVADVRERDRESYGRSIHVYGVDKGFPASEVTAKLRQLVEQFLVTESGPIRVIIVQIGDSPLDHIYVPHRPGAEVETLLREWSVSSMKFRTRAYERLGTARLEVRLRMDES